MVVHKPRAAGTWCGTRRQRAAADMQSAGNACTHTVLITQLTIGARAHPSCSKPVLRLGPDMAARRPKTAGAAAGCGDAAWAAAASSRTVDWRRPMRRTQAASRARRAAPGRAACGCTAMRGSAGAASAPYTLSCMPCCVRPGAASERHTCQRRIRDLGACCALRCAPGAAGAHGGAVCPGPPGLLCFQRQQPARMRQRCAALGPARAVPSVYTHILTHT